MNSLVESKQLVKIVLISGREIITNIDLDKLEKAVETSKMVKVNGILINTGSISTMEPFNGDDVDSYIAGITDYIIKDRLLSIQKERKAKDLKINGIKHLISIYTDRYGEISNDKSIEG